MAPRSRSLPRVYAANASQLQLPVRRSARSFIKRADRRLSALEAEVRKLKDYSKSQNKAKKPQKKLKDKLQEKLATRKTSNHANPTSSRLHDQDKYEIIITPTINKRIIYTHNKIEGKNGEPIKVAIYKNGEKDTSKRFASLRLEMLAINGDFCEKGEENWTYEEFDNNVVREREGMGPILAGPLVVDLVNGEATLDGLVFKDNSSWARKKMFRIGARVLKRFKVRVKEGITKPLRVKDHHCKATEKPRVPKLKHRVKCLTGVGKTRISDLKKNKIHNVKDFLRQFYMDESQLLKIVGIKSKSHNSWKYMVEHAKKCKVGPRLYSYRVENQNVLLFFSRVYELVGAEINGHYKHFNKLTVSKKALVNKWKKEFYKKVKDLKLDFTMGQNGPIPLEFDSSEPQLPMEPIDLDCNDLFHLLDPIGAIQDGKSTENICSTSERCVNKTRDCENIPSKDNMGGSLIPNQEQYSNLVPSVSNFELVQGTDSTIWDENQVSSVPESSNNNPPENGSLSMSDKFIIECDDEDLDLSDFFDIDFTPIDTQPTKLRVKLRDIAIAVYWIKSVMHEVRRKKARSASQNGESIVSSD